jgi:hypothetical protein
MSKASENFIETYLLTHGYPLTDSNRGRAREVLAQHPQPEFDLVGSSALERIALLDRKMGISAGWLRAIRSQQA